MGEQPPLSTLLSWAWIAFTIESDNAAEAAGAERERIGRLFRISMPVWANGLRFIEDEGTTVSDLRTRARAACNIGGMERWGWISVGEPGDGRRDGYGSHRGVTASTVLRPTRAGAYARKLWPRVITRVEQRWEERFGADAVGSLREALRPFAGQTSSAPPEIHASDGLRTHVIDGPANQDDSLPGLLGQALTALTLEYERGSATSLPIAANVLRVIGHQTVRLRDLPALSGVSKEAIAMTTGWLARRGLTESRPERSIALTGPGRGTLAGYEERPDGPANRPTEPLRAALETILARPEVLAEGLVPPEGTWRGQKPYLAQTKRVLANPLTALPWQPMVLHRGGWPDGS